MKIISFKNRRILTNSIIVILLAIQFVLFLLWHNQFFNELKLSQSIYNFENSKLLAEKIDEANKHYVTSQLDFNEYLATYNKENIKKYKTSIHKLEQTIKSIDSLSKKDSSLSKLIVGKKEKEKRIIILKLKLDSLINFNLNTSTFANKKEFGLEKFDSKKILKSITYDSIKFKNDVVKRSLLARIGQAIRGKYDIKKEELQVYIRILYGDGYKTDTYENQLKNIFATTEKHYEEQFNKLKKTNILLRDNDVILVKINKDLVNLLRESFELYENKNDLSLSKNKDNFVNQYRFTSSQRTIIIYSLMVLMFIATLVLLLFVRIANTYEKKLTLAKSKADNNVVFKNRLIGMLSHELRSPLQIIIKLSEYLTQKNKDKVLEEAINNLNFTSNSILITANQILEFSKNENKKMVAYNATLSLKDELNNIYNAIKSLASHKKIEVIANFDLSIDKKIQIDAGKLHQLFYNIVGNAIKFTDKGNITIQAKTETLNDFIKVIISIKDT